MNTAQRIAEADRRRAILAALLLAPAYTMQSRALRAQIESIGYAVSLDRLGAEVAWLIEIGLVNVVATNQVDQAIQLTDRGMDIVMGRAQVPGVRRPEPGEL